jgi:AraC-like DNA-binding protein
LAVASGERRARFTHHEHQLGEWMRARRAPDRRLSGLLVRELLAYRHSRAEFDTWLEPPRPELTLMIDFEGALRADGEPLPGAWIGGLSETYTIVGFGDTYGAIDLKLHPLGAYTLLGLPLSELTGRCVALSDVFGRSGAALPDRLRDLPSWDARFDAVEDFLTARMASGPRPDPAVLSAWRRLSETAGSVRVEALAAELGCSRRYLQSKFRDQVGMAPKAVARQLRFADVCRRIEQTPRRWSEIAFAAGYADQSHLNREFREFAGTTPTEFVARRIPGGGLVGDGCDPGRPRSQSSKTRERVGAMLAPYTDPLPAR